MFDASMGAPYTFVSYSQRETRRRRRSLTEFCARWRTAVYGQKAPAMQFPLIQIPGPKGSLSLKQGEHSPHGSHAVDDVDEFEVHEPPLHVKVVVVTLCCPPPVHCSVPVGPQGPKVVCVVPHDVPLVFRVHACISVVALD
jgi:hypothetical protein